MPTVDSTSMTGERISYILWWIKVFSEWQHDGTVFFPLVDIVLVHLNAIGGRNIGFSACCDRKSEDCRVHLIWWVEDGLICLRTCPKLSNFINLHSQTVDMCTERQ